jgi:hypothetical protein
MRHKITIIKDMIRELYSTLDLLLLAQIEHESEREKKDEERSKKKALK